LQQLAADNGLPAASSGGDGGNENYQHWAGEWQQRWLTQGAEQDGQGTIPANDSSNLDSANDEGTSTYGEGTSDMYGSDGDGDSNFSSEDSSGDEEEEGQEEEQQRTSQDISGDDAVQPFGDQGSSSSRSERAQESGGGTGQLHPGISLDGLFSDFGIDPNTITESEQQVDLHKIRCLVSAHCLHLVFQRVPPFAHRNY
jgi:hypothetical protein